METQAFTEEGSPSNDATRQRNNRFAWCLGICLVLWVLSLLSCLIACLLFHHNQSREPCWFHASSPVSSQASIRWTWIRNCSSSAMDTNEYSSLEILESGVYFAYVYVTCKEKDCFKNNYFTVHLVTKSDKLSDLKGPSVPNAFVSFGRPFFLEKWTRLHLEINENLEYIDINRTYWGLYKI